MSTIKRFEKRVVATAFGRAMKDARSKQKMTHELLAEKADLHETYPSLLERGLRDPGLAIVIAIGDALGIGGDTLVRKTIELLRREQPPQ